MIIGWFATEEDKPYFNKFSALLGTHAVKVSTKPQEYKAAIFAKIKALKLDAIICTCSETLVKLLETQPDFRHPLDKRGLKRRLSLDAYAGSFFTIPAEVSGAETDTQVLCLNSPKQLMTVPSAPFVFKRFLSKLFKPDSWFPQTKFTWEIWKPERASYLYDLLSSGRLLSVDIETAIGDPDRRIRCVGYCVLSANGTTHSVVVPFTNMQAWDFVRRVNACSVPKLFQNGLYDNLYFARWGVPCTAWLHDTQHMFHSWYSELPKRLDFITAFCVRTVRYWKDDSAGGDFELYEYNAKDCWATMMTYLSMLQIKDSWVIQNYLIEFPLVFPCLHVEMDGITIDRKVYEERKAAIVPKVESILTELQIWIGAGFNPNSPKQVLSLMHAMGFKAAESSGEKELMKFSTMHPLNAVVVEKILEYRGLTKLLSTYFVEDKFWHWRLHYKLNPAGTDTGRLASSESSFWCGLQIQNIPGGPDVKSWLVCDDDWEGLAEADYAQSEARCVGYMSGCKTLIELVESDRDYHSVNAERFFQIPYDDIWDQALGKAKNKKIRDLSKRTNHGANYNMGGYVMLETIGIPMAREAQRILGLPKSWDLVRVCQHMLDQYARTYPEVKTDLYNHVKRTISITKKLVSPLGWTRYFFDDPMKSKPALNAAVAHGPQNLSVTIINECFYAIWRDSVYGDLRDKIRLKAQIHDSIFFAYRGIDNAEIVRKRMENPKEIADCKGVKRTMLIPPDLSAGKKVWAELK